MNAGLSGDGDEEILGMRGYKSLVMGICQDLYDGKLSPTMSMCCIAASGHCFLGLREVMRDWRFKSR